jgi:hypothetical protein
VAADDVVVTQALRPARGLVNENHKWIALFITTLGMLMAAIDGSIVLLALPAIFRGIHLDPPARSEEPVPLQLGADPEPRNVVNTRRRFGAAPPALSFSRPDRRAAQTARGWRAGS